MARWKAHVLVKNMGFKNMNMNSFLLSVIELLFLSLAVEVLQGKTFQNLLPSGGARSLGAKISGEVVTPCQYIDTTRKAIDCTTTLPLTVFI